jgi:hypothetical protein
MTDYRKTTRKRAGEAEMQTGFLGLGDLDASAQLLNIDPTVPVDNKTGLGVSVRLRHGYEYVSGDDTNRCEPGTADAINLGGFIAGAGAASGAALAVGSAPLPGARVVSLGVLAAGGIGSVGQGYLEEMTGGFQFSVKVAAKRDEDDEWTQLGQALPCVPTAPLVGDAKRDVQFPVYSPPEEGEWTVKVIMETMKGQKLGEATREITVQEGAKGADPSNGEGFDFQQWVLDNPAKAAGGALLTLVSTRAVIDNSLGG